MMRNVDRAFGWLLILGACGHTAGTILSLEPMSGIFLWSLGSSLAAFLLGTLNLVRAGRPADRTLAAITLAGTAAWFVLALAFGKSIGNVWDPRAVMHMAASAGLVIFSGLTLRGGGTRRTDRPNIRMPRPIES